MEKEQDLERIRGFTEVELVLLERILSKFVDIMKEPWENVTEIRPRLEKD